MPVSDYAWSAGNAGGLSSTTSDIGSFFNDLNGTTANNIFNSQEAERARLYNSAEAQKDRDFQEMMSNTAYQRQVADMEAAGLNPAAINGDGASTPQGSRAGGVQASATPGHGSHLISDLANLALRVALFNKFSNSAKAAKTPSAAVEVVDKQATSAKKAHQYWSSSHKQLPYYGNRQLGYTPNWTFSK